MPPPPTDEKAPTDVELRYFNTLGKGAPIREVLRYMGVPFKDHRYSDPEAEFKNGDKLTARFGQVPLLRVTVEGKRVELAQTAAILRYLARAFQREDLYPTGVKGQLCDALIDFEQDFALGESAIRYQGRFGLVLDEEQSAKGYMERFEEYLAMLERTLVETPDTPWVAGTPTPTIADFVWGARLRRCYRTIMEWGDKDLPDRIKKNAPNVMRFLGEFEELPCVKSA